MTCERFGEEQGVGLVELLIVMLLFGIVGAITITGLVSGMQATTHADTRIEALTTTQTALANAARDIRAADSRDSAEEAALRAADPAEIEFDVLRDGARIRYVLTVAGGELREHRRVWNNASDDPDSTTPNSDGTRVLVRELVETDQQPVFAYRDDAGDCLSGCLDAAGELMTDPVASAHLPRVAEVHLTVRRDVGLDQGRPPIEVETRVQLRNGGDQ